MSRLLRLSKAPADLTVDETTSIVHFTCHVASLSTEPYGGISSVFVEEDVRRIVDLLRYDHHRQSKKGRGLCVLSLFMQPRIP